MKTKSKRPSVTTRKKLIAKLDKLVGQLVRSRGACELEGKDHVTCGGALQWCHILTRSNYRLRHEPMAALCLCAGHHRYYTTHAWEWKEIVKTFFPKQYEFVEALREEKIKNMSRYYEDLEWSLKKDGSGSFLVKIETKGYTRS